MIEAAVVLFAVLAGFALILKVFYEGEAKLPPSPPTIQPDPVWRTTTSGPGATSTSYEVTTPDDVRNRRSATSTSDDETGDEA